ncbi:MAG: hypothetical protein MUP11_10390, partial [Anaerolineales bacterium]|nr:hypothetical protein [Anaerolineales bacterium]
MKVGSRIFQYILGFIIVLFLIVLLKTAWVSDDAYITFRSVENFIHGYGLVHNVGERVQTYTHPLWFFLQSGANYFFQKVLSFDFWSQMYYVNIILSISISAVTILVLSFSVAKTVQGAIAAILILINSKAFMDYSTSGLENPLTHLVIILFFLVYIQNNWPLGKKLFLLSLLACLGALNRLDTILLFIPALLIMFFQEGVTFRKFISISMGFAPLILWEFFSLFYYGTLFPNTAYAKLNTGISRLALINQSVKYYKHSLAEDPITLIVIAGTVLFVLIKRTKSAIPFVISIFLYLGYVLMIGGDFMSGRFFAVILLIAAAVLSREINVEKQSLYYGILLTVVLLGVFNPSSPLCSALDYGEGDFHQYVDEYGISDERAVYYSYLGLLSPNKDKGFPGSKYSGADWIYDENKRRVELVGPLGVEGYSLGPNVHVIDKNSLSDPLMTRLPLSDPDNWRIGHFKHSIPAGYLETLSSGKNEIHDPDIAAYYGILRFIVRGDLFNPER